MAIYAATKSYNSYLTRGYLNEMNTDKIDILCSKPSSTQT